MKKITVELMQHTPMIHFQYDQDGATLRASEVKPKLDRFLLNKLGKDVKKEWLVGSGTHDALDYKMRFEAGKLAKDVQLTAEKVRTKWKADFPMLLSNIMGGGQVNKEDLRFFSMHETVTMHLSFFSKEYKDKETGEKIQRDESWYKKLNLNENLPKFFATTNFGQRSNKGFGSFTVSSICIDDEKPIDYDGRKYAVDELYFDYFIAKGHNVYDLQNQKKLFKKIDDFWKKLGDNIKDRDIEYGEVNSTKSYMKALKEIICKKEKDPTGRPVSIPTTDDVQRMPAPIIFKPISFKKNDALWYSVYIMFDKVMFNKMRDYFKTKNINQVSITPDNKHILKPEGINGIGCIIDFVDSDYDINMQSKNEVWHYRINGIRYILP